MQNSSGETGASLHPSDDSSGNILYDLPLSDMSSTDTLTFQVTNNWLRHLSACVQYLDIGGNVLAPQNWSEKVPGFVRASFEPDSSKPLAALVPPVATVFGVLIG